ncbi:hypothetical protein ACWCPJ_38525 [Streptomyces collinus]
MGKSSGWVTQRLALLKLTPELKQALEDKELPVKVARTIGQLPEQQQQSAADEALAKRAKQKAESGRKLRGAYPVSTPTVTTHEPRDSAPATSRNAWHAPWEDLHALGPRSCERISRRTTATHWQSCSRVGAPASQPGAPQQQPLSYRWRGPPVDFARLQIGAGAVGAGGVSPPAGCVAGDGDADFDREVGGHEGDAQELVAAPRWRASTRSRDGCSRMFGLRTVRCRAVSSRAIHRRSGQAGLRIRC